MKQTIRLFFPRICLALLPVLSWGQCDPYFNPPLSPRTASYDISLALDTGAKIIKASETLTWINASPDTLREMRFYMYLNAFKNSESTFLKGATEIFGQDFTRRNAGEWGWINVDSIGRQGGRELTPGIRYIQPDDGNPQDQSVLQVPLDRPLMPGDTLVLHLKFTAKMPKIIARAGYSKDDYFMFTHWFPQAGVYQVNLDGQWGWNCHQFHRMTEFFADFGSYDVKITAAKRLVTGASGCLVGEQENGDGTVTRHYHADDVIDFAWVAYPYFEIYEEKWEHVNIRLLIPPEHCMMAERYIGVIKHSLSYLTEHVGRYPYPTITIVDPPMHALRSGLMEYPTLITAGSFYNTPICFHNSEALAAHEFAHQYFMAMVASNEKEEAWLDEGFVTWFEDRIVDDAFGQKRSLVDLFGYRYDSQELSRLEYTGMKNPKAGIIARPSWEFAEARKELIYSKTATSLETLRNLAGEEVMDKIFKAYFERWKFRHPKGTDFLAVLEEVGKRELGEAEGGRLLAIFKECLYTTDICDYLVSDIVINKISTPTGLFDAANGGHVFEKGKTTDQYHSEVVLYRKGDMIFAQEVEIVFDNGEKITEQWDGTDRRKVFEYEGYRRVVSAHIDPQQKILLDLDLNNNSLTLEPKTSPLLRYATRAVYWIQNILQTLSFIC